MPKISFIQRSAVEWLSNTGATRTGKFLFVFDSRHLRDGQQIAAVICDHDKRVVDVPMKKLRFQNTPTKEVA
jgi:hypothetical protein